MTDASTPTARSREFVRQGLAGVQTDAERRRVLLGEIEPVLATIAHKTDLEVLGLLNRIAAELRSPR